MHDVNGKTLKVGDEIMTSRFGLCKVTSLTDHIIAKNVRGEGFSYNQRLLDELRAFKVRTWKELAAEAVAVQDACNLSGVVHSFSRTISEVRARLESEGKGSTDEVNRHPICILYSDKIASLTGVQLADCKFIMKAYDWAQEQKEKE